MTATLTHTGDIAVITMDDGKANAVSYAMIDSLNSALDESEAARAVVLAGRPGVFSGGFDLSVMKAGDMAAVTELVKRGGILAHRLYGLKKPLIAAATGHGIAMGAFMLMASDTRIGPEASAKYGMNETAIGMVIPMFAQVLAEERLSLRHRTGAFIQATIYDSQGAVDAGYLDRLVAQDAVVAKAVEEAEQLAQYPTDAYAGNKLTIRANALARMAQALGLSDGA
ncbi:MAG: crotonase/enoyl-CoA hydratase family protein [Pseudomonadota bacterium]